MYKYDFLIVGAGLYGATFARLAADNHKKVLVIDKREHIGGNIYSKNIDGIETHVYGAHIFHTNSKVVWDFVNKYAVFNRYTNSPVANYKGEIYSLPFNMYTFNKMWSCVTPDEAMIIIEKQKQELHIAEPKNLEEQAICLVGTDIYTKLIKGYTEKQWGRSCKDLPPSIIKRLPVRYTYDNNYFNALYQGIPVKGYTDMVNNILEGIEVKLGVNYLEDRNTFNSLADTAIYTGAIDEFFDYKFGPLEYRSLKFETEVLDKDNYQGNAVVNYTDRDTPFTRIIEHKWFNFGKDQQGNHVNGKTVVSREYSVEWHQGMEAYYPVLDEKNISRYQSYSNLAKEVPNVVFGGRLGEYKYFDMDQVILSAMDRYHQIAKQI